MKAIIVALFGVFVCFAAHADDQLRVQVESGNVQIVDEGGTLTPAESNAIKNFVASKVTQTPFSRSGKLEFVLKQQAVADLKRELQGIDLSNQRRVNRALARVWEDVEDKREAREDRNEDRGLASQVMVGQDFNVGEKEVLGDIVAIGSNGSIDGQVGDLVVIGGNVNLTSKARVNGSLVTLGSNVTRDQGAMITGEEVRASIPTDLAGWWGSRRMWSMDRERSWAQMLGAAVLSFLGAFAIGCLLLAIAPGPADASQRFLREHPAHALGIGLVGTLAIGPAILVLIITIVGILLIPFFVLAAAVLYMLGYVTAGLAIGQALHLGRINNLYARLAIGLLLIKMVGLVPWLGSFFVFLISAAGFGAIIRQGYVMYRTRRPSPPAEERTTPAYA